jgi:hypothetical protein
VIAISPDAPAEIERLLPTSEIRVQVFASTDLRTRSIAYTPTVILADRSGRVIESWVGLLAERKEGEVISRAASGK